MSNRGQTSHCESLFLFYCLMEYHSLDSSLAYGAEALGSVVAHSADIRRTVDAL